MKFFKPILLIMIFSLFGCWSTGYQKQHGNWVWVTRDVQYGKRSNVIAAADNATFEVLADKKYARDKDRAYYCGKEIRDVEAGSFKLLNDKGYARDARRVYLDGLPVLYGDPQHFEILEYPYARDSERLFCGTLPVMGLSAEEVKAFQVTNEDKLMAGMRSTMMMPYFTEFNPDYKWVDSMGVDGVMVGEWGTGVAMSKKIKGFKVVE